MGTFFKICTEDSQMWIQPDECRWHLFDKGPAALLNDGCCGYEDLAKRLSSPLPSPVMVLYIYDDDYWGYFLYQNGMELDRFASLPDYFEPGFWPVFSVRRPGTLNPICSPGLRQRPPLMRRMSMPAKAIFTLSTTPGR